ncbi:hypothetical protein J6590_023038 [Homalodisca vitripennis]|nr:hypothetical protein J6590_023038 [Homalodisca vitripennis]
MSAPTPDRRGRTVPAPTNSEIVALGLHTEMCGLTVTEPSPHRYSADSRVGHGAVIGVSGRSGTGADPTRTLQSWN